MLDMTVKFEWLAMWYFVMPPCGFYILQLCLAIDDKTGWNPPC